MKRLLIYFTLLVVLSVLSWWWSGWQLSWMLPQFWPLLFAMTLAPVLLAYSIAALPLFWALRTKGYRRWGLVLAAGSLMFLVAWLPHRIGSWQFEKIRLEYTADDVSVPAQVKPRSIQVSDLYRHYGECLKLCQALLFDYGLPEVNAVFTRDSHLDASGRLVYPEHRMRYRIVHQERCSEVLPPPEEKYRLRIAAGDCLIAEEADQIAPDAEISLKAVQSDPDLDRCSRRISFASLDYVRQLEIRERAGAELEAAVRQTSVNGFVAPFPFRTGLVGCGQYNHRLALASQYVQGAGLDLLEALVQRYGLARQAPSAAEAAVATLEGKIAVYRRILNRSYPAAAQLTESEDFVVQQVMGAVLAKPKLDAGDIALLRLAVKQPAKKQYLLIPLFQSKTRGDLAALLPDLVARLEEPSVGKDNFLWSVAQAISVMPPEDLAPLRARLIGLVMDRDKSRYMGEVTRRHPELTSGR